LGAIGVTALFIAISCWWLTQDRSIPIFDAGLHLSLGYSVHHELGAGKLVNALTLSSPIRRSPISSVRLACCSGGERGGSDRRRERRLRPAPRARLLQGRALGFAPTAGLLAVVFALGSPLLIAQFHVFMVDAPETAMVAVSVWLIIATEGFARLGTSALAGLAVGLGMLTKEPLAIFVLGIVLVTAFRGGAGGMARPPALRGGRAGTRAAVVPP
jgi:hypothetical protein